MKHIVELSKSGEDALQRLSLSAGVSGEQLLTSLSESIIAGDAEVATHDKSADIIVPMGSKRLRIQAKFQPNAQPLSSAPDVMGGDICVRKTRIPLWLLVAYKQAGQTDAEILANYPSLNAADLTGAWDYYAAHSAEIDRQRLAQLARR